MKKGFTLVELAIVLVVIGLLLGMAFKGKSLIDAARIKTDIYKVQKLEAAINTYYAKYNTIPGLDGITKTTSDKAIYDELIKEGALKDSDFKMNTLKTRFHFAACNEGSRDGNKLWIAKDAIFNENTPICITTSPDLPVDTTIEWDKTRQSNEMVCYFETLLDDKNTYSGDGRRQESDAQAVEVNDCQKAKLNDTTGNKLGYSYFYKIF